MKVEYLLYLTPVEELMFNVLFNGIEKVELDETRKARRIRLANGKLKNLLDEVGQISGNKDHDRSLKIRTGKLKSYRSRFLRKIQRKSHKLVLARS